GCQNGKYIGNRSGGDTKRRHCRNNMEPVHVVARHSVKLVAYVNWWICRCCNCPCRFRCGKLVLRKSRPAPIGSFDNHCFYCTGATAWWSCFVSDIHMAATF